jgi:hypothetical protein
MIFAKPGLEVFLRLTLVVSCLEIEGSKLRLAASLFYLLKLSVQRKGTVLVQQKQ